jgi:hypothetical protein
MAWKKGSAFRSDPGSGQRIRVNTFLDPVDGNTIVQETLLFAGAPAWFIKIGSSEQTNLRDYPYTGGSPALFANTTSISGLTVQLNNAAMDGGVAGSQGSNALNPAGLGLMILDGSAKGDVRRITGWNSGAPTSSNKTVVLERGVSAQVSMADHYVLGFVCLHDTELLIKTEFSANDAAAPTAKLLVRYMDLPQTEAGVQRAPIPYLDRIIDVLNLGVTIDGGAAYQGQILSVPCKGGTLATVLVHTKPASGTLDVWVTSV